MPYDASSDVHNAIHDLVSKNRVVLFMKGSPASPLCGFSATAAKILELNGAKNFVHVDVLQAPAIREAIKEYSSWPTIPQLYISGEFIGGADIMRELHSNGELAQMLQQ